MKLCIKEGNGSSIDGRSSFSLVSNGRRNAKFMVKMSVLWLRKTVINLSGW